MSQQYYDFSNQIKIIENRKNPVNRSSLSSLRKLNDYGMIGAISYKGSSSFLAASRSPTENRYRDNYSDQKIVIRRGELVRRSVEPLLHKNGSLPQIRKGGSQLTSIDNNNPYNIRQLSSKNISAAIYDPDQLDKLKENKKKIYSKKIKDEK